LDFGFTVSDFGDLVRLRPAWLFVIVHDAKVPTAPDGTPLQ